MVILSVSPFTAFNKNIHSSNEIKFLSTKRLKDFHNNYFIIKWAKNPRIKLFQNKFNGLINFIVGNFADIYSFWKVF